MLLAIDPGRDTGWAEFTADKKLYDCGVGDPRLRTSVPENVVIELPQIYRMSHNKKDVDPNDLIKVAVQVGEYKQFFSAPCMGRVLLVWPAAWKGQTPKHIHNQRVYTWLSPVEQELVHQRGLRHGAKTHNMIDAVGLGCWFLKRDMVWSATR